MRLTDLLNGSEIEVRGGSDTATTAIRGLTCDSRRVEPGFLFAALPGTRTDGRAFIEDALVRGAAAVLAPPGTEIGLDRAASGRAPVAVIVDANPRRRFALMAARFFGRQPKVVAAVTGTNGKSSVAAFLRQIWMHLGRPAATLGTLGVQAPGIDAPGSLTTPDPVELHRTLARLAADGVDHLAMEASSHGLDQFRLDGVRIAAAAFTNLGRDHLDYHGSSAAYLAAKRRLFSDLVADGGAAVLNADAPERGMLAAAAKRGLRILTYGERGAEVRLVGAEALDDGQRLVLEVLGRERSVALPLVGRFQAMNALCALALAVATDCETDAAIAALERLKGVPGRVQRIARRDDGVAVYVDYAHTPDALAAVLDALRPHTVGRLWVVFGCGGDRDAGKRPEMGRIAAERADRVVVTDDNPRSEDPALIRQQVRQACPAAVEIAGRGEAIAFAVAGLEPGDVLVVAGKGHETGQIVGDRVLPFDDAAAVRAALGAVRR